MSEPRTVAKKLIRVIPGVFRCEILDERIGAKSDAYALVQDGTVILVDPLPVDPKRIRKLGRVEAILLSVSSHQRSAWRYRRLFRARVWAPRGAKGLEEKPDFTYRDGDRLPGGVIARHAPGPTDAHYLFHLRRRPGVIFCSDLLISRPGKGIDFISAEYQDAPALTRRSVGRLARLRFGVLCFGHGAPLRTGVRRALKALLKTEWP